MHVPQVCCNVLDMDVVVACVASCTSSGLIGNCVVCVLLQRAVETSVCVLTGRLFELGQASHRPVERGFVGVCGEVGHIVLVLTTVA